MGEFHVGDYARYTSPHLHWLQGEIVRVTAVLAGDAYKYKVVFPACSREGEWKVYSRSLEPLTDEEIGNAAAWCIAVASGRGWTKPATTTVKEDAA